MRALSLRLLTILGLSLCLVSCQNTKEELQLEPATDYFRLEPGKYITYRLDSTVFTKLGRNSEIHSYEEKHLVDAEFLDNSGRKSYRVFRYLRDTSGNQPWSSSGTYFITPLTNSVEVVENNMRVVKFVSPVREGYTWKGNQYLAADPYAPEYNFSNNSSMKYWEFEYSNTNGVFPYKQQNMANVVTVLQVDERDKIDTVDVMTNMANIPKNAQTAWIKGRATNATDTIIINAQQPADGKDKMTIYNRTNAPATLNGIVIPPNLALYFEFSNGKWYYPNALTVVNNKVTLPYNSSQAFIVGPATAEITVDASRIDTMQTKVITIYNRSNKDAYVNFNTAVSSYKIPPGKGRTYQLYQKQWRLFDNKDQLLEHESYITDQPYVNTSYSVEKYAKGLGLVFQELSLWEYQPPTDAGGSGYFTGFGVKRSMIDHN